MATLILRTADGVDVGCCGMAPDERTFYYRAFTTDDLISFEGRRYRIETVQWRVPEDTLMLTVVFDSLDRLGCGCAVGSCTCPTL